MEIQFIFKELHEETLAILREARNEFKTKLRERNKRIICAGLCIAAALVAGTIAGSMAGTATAYLFTRKISKRVDKLEHQLGNLKEGVKSIGEELTTLAKTVADITKEVDRRIKLIEKSMNEQISAISKTFNWMMEYQHIVQITNIQTMSLQNILIMELDKIRMWDHIFLKLQEAKLPRDLISYEKLDSLLTEIKAQLLGKYELGIRPEMNSL